MAGIDKIRGTNKELYQLTKWIAENCKIALPYLRNFYIDPPSTKYFTIANFPEHIDNILWIYCPLKFVRDRLKEQYSAETLNEWSLGYEIYITEIENK